jgi:hypothetical protein
MSGPSWKWPTPHGAITKVIFENDLPVGRRSAGVGGGQDQDNATGMEAGTKTFRPRRKNRAVSIRALWRHGLSSFARATTA